MPAVTRTRRSQWIAAGLHALAGGGPDAVRVEALAAGLGVTKGGFYGHFADRNALLEEMLDSWERMSTDEVLERVVSIFQHELRHTGVIHIGSAAQAREGLFSRVVHLVRLSGHPEGGEAAAAAAPAARGAQ